MDVLCLGIITCDILVRIKTENILECDTTIAKSITMNVGGDALNVAINLAKMGMTSGICGKIGNDTYGKYISNTVKRIGVESEYISIDSEDATSTSIVLISNEGKRNFIFYPGTTSNFSIEDVKLEWLDNTKVLAIGSYFTLSSFSKDSMSMLLSCARKRGVMTVLDVTNNPDENGLADMEQILPYIDYFIPSYDEASAISGLEDAYDIAKFFWEKGAKTVIIKLGSKGALGFDENGSVYIPATPDCPVDTTGAGDCFVAGLIAAILKGFSLKKSMVFAAKAAGLSITKVGATTATVNFDEIDKRYIDYEKGGECN